MSTLLCGLGLFELWCIPLLSLKSKLLFKSPTLTSVYTSVESDHKGNTTLAAGLIELFITHSVYIDIRHHLAPFALTLCTYEQLNSRYAAPLQSIKTEWLWAGYLHTYCTFTDCSTSAFYNKMTIKLPPNAIEQDKHLYLNHVALYSIELLTICLGKDKGIGL